MNYKRCEQKRRDCFACHYGKCLILNNTHFEKGGRKYKCPFYKTTNSSDIPTKKQLLEGDFDETETNNS